MISRSPRSLPVAPAFVAVADAPPDVGLLDARRSAPAFVEPQPARQARRQRSEGVDRMDDLRPGIRALAWVLPMARRIIRTGGYRVDQALCGHPTCFAGR